MRRPPASLPIPLTFALVLLLALAAAPGCTDDSAASSLDEVALLDDADAVLDSLLARWQTATADVSGFTLATDVFIARYVRRPDGTFGPVGVEPRTAEAAQGGPPPVQFLHPDRQRVAALLRGRSDLVLDPTAAPPRYRLVARPEALAVPGGVPTLDSTATPEAADIVVEAGTYHLREVRTRSPLPGSEVDSAVVDLRIAYGDYRVVDGLAVPHAVSVNASGLLETFDEGQLMFMRAQYQQRLSRAANLTGEARAAEEAELADLKALLLDGTSTETMQVDSVAVQRDAE
ncbi:MAG: hypothetical protein AAF809_02545 [Bacteroidota bacterium]